MRLIPKNENLNLCAGIFFILASILFNGWLVIKLSSPGISLSMFMRVAIWVINGAFLTAGMLFLFFRRDIAFAKAAVVFAAFLLTFALAEVSLGLFEKPDQVEAKLYDEEYHHNYCPGYKFIRRPKKGEKFLPAENIINSIGIRGPEIPEKKPGEYRILLLGDSFLQADENDFEKTAGQVLQNMFSGRNIKVIQHGMGGWSPLTELNWLIKTGLPLKPDYAVLFLIVNDFWGIHYSSDAHYTEEAVFDEKGLPVRFLLSEKWPVWESSSIYRLLRSVNEGLSEKKEAAVLDENALSKEQIQALLSVDDFLLTPLLKAWIPDNVPMVCEMLRDTIRLTRDPSLWDAGTHKRVKLTCGYIKKMKGVLDEKKTGLAVTLLPVSWNISRSEDASGRKRWLLSHTELPMGGIEKYLRTFSAENGIDYIDLYVPFRNFSRKNKEKLFWEGEGHWTDAGQKAVAETLRKFFSREDRLKNR